MRTAFTSLLLVAAALTSAPAPAADLDGGHEASLAAGGPAIVSAGPFVVYDFEPGIVARAYWVRPWAGRHYYPSGGKLPVVGRREVDTPAPASDKRSYHREWSSFPIDTIQQPPLILNQPQYFPSGEVAPPTVSK